MATIIANNLEIVFPEATVLLKTKAVHELSFKIQRNVVCLIDQKTKKDAITGLYLVVTSIDTKKIHIC